MAKRTREQNVREKRAMKVEKKAAAAAARAAGVDGTLQVETDDETGAAPALETPEASEEPAGA